jgi:hypothetical protein
MTTEKTQPRLPSDCPPDGTWLTNERGEYSCLWPIRYGDPKATENHDVAALKRMGLHGVYVCWQNDAAQGRPTKEDVP